MAKTTTTVGRLLVNDILPASHQITGETNKSKLNALMADLARTDARKYVDTITNIKRRGDEIATNEGLTIGLDDIEPLYEKRDSILEPYLAKAKKTKDPKEKVRLIEAAQKELLVYAKEHPGQAGFMVRSGSRGSAVQAMKVMASPVGATGPDGTITPWMVSKSFAEGLKAPDAWVMLGESRRNAVLSNTTVAEPGEVSKLLVNNMSDQLITTPDCGTVNGVLLKADDPQVMDRYLAKATDGVPAGTLITGQIAAKFHGKTIVVRSPMTCDAPHGICQRCYGINNRGQAPRIGDNVGMIAAQAMSEPLTQLALSSKHGVATVGSKSQISGLPGFRQMTEIPQSFFSKATVAQHDGLVTSIVPAPQGGHYIHVDKTEHYAPPTVEVQVKKGDRVEAGDALTYGVPKPDEVVAHKGLGAGRRYLVDQLHGIYARGGVDMDRRHLELLAKTDLNYVRILDRNAEQLGLMRGDVIDYNRFRNAIAEQTKLVPTKDAIGETLGNNVLHYTAGTRVTPSMLEDFQQTNIKQVPIAPRIPAHEPIMKPIARTPLLHPDWLGRLGHRNLKKTIMEGAAFGESANIHGYDPVPAFVIGEEFGTGPQGRY